MRVCLPEVRVSKMVEPEPDAGAGCRRLVNAGRCSKRARQAGGIPLVLLVAACSGRGDGGQL